MTNPWSKRFIWFWLNDKEIFEFTDEDFEKRAKQLADRGVTVAITFSNTHFRFSFYPYWNEINECIKKTVNACHKYGIRVVEHHSASLKHNLLSSAGWKRLEDDLGSFSGWTSSVDSWKKVPPYLVCDPEIGGVPLSSFYQIDGRTGKPVVSVYDSDCMCYNNPDYRKAYFSYVESVCKTGIDGIMNDDVQYFGDGNACTCVHCRRMFREKTGYKLPEPDDWDSFYGDYQNPAFIAWESFKRESTRDFYHALSDFYRTLGLNLIRPNYSSDVLWHNKTSYGFDTSCDIWDFIFQENCYSAVLKASYLNFMIEAVHRYAKGERHSVPSMSMFYPDREDSAYFGWALARSWGQMYTGTCEGRDISDLEKKYRDFEKEHEDLYSYPKKLADVSFYFSRKTRDYTHNAAYEHMLPFMSDMQAAYVSGLGVDMVFEEDSFEELQKHPFIIASHVAMMSDDEIRRFYKYAALGGRLLILGDFASFKTNGRKRSYSEIAELLGVNVKIREHEYIGKSLMEYDGKKLCLDNSQSRICFEETENIICRGQDGSALGIREKLGAGELIWLPFRSNKNEFQLSIWSNRRQKQPPMVDAMVSVVETLKKTSGAMQNLIVQDPVITVECENKEVYATCFAVGSGYAVHLINTADTLAKAPCKIGHGDIITNFDNNAKKLPQINVSMKKLKDQKTRAVTLYTPELKNPVTLNFKDYGDKVSFTVNRDVFSGYALIAVDIN